MASPQPLLLEIHKAQAPGTDMEAEVGPNANPSVYLLVVRPLESGPPV